MPLRFARKIPQEALLGLWMAEESLDWFAGRLVLEEEERQELAGVHPGRQLDFYSTRYLLHLLHGDRERRPCLKDTFGCPYLVGAPTRISISHSHHMAAVIVGVQACGIDIQRWDARLLRLAPRFAAPEERAFLQGQDQQQGLQVLWGAKEALFKAYARGGLDFRAHLHCAPFQLGHDRGQLEATIAKPAETPRHFDVSYRFFEEGVLVWAMEKMAIFEP